MRKWVFITGILFTFGNATWRYFELEKLYWLPLGIFLFTLVRYVAENPKPASYPMKCSLYYLLILASGNIVKQAFYQDGLFQISDYWWGGIVTLCYLLAIFKDWLLEKLNILLKWVLRRKQGGRK